MLSTPLKIQEEDRKSSSLSSFSQRQEQEVMDEEAEILLFGDDEETKNLINERLNRKEKVNALNQFEQAVELCEKKKISKENAWNLKTIENIHSILAVLNGSLPKAASTIEASVDIYEKRVEDTMDTAMKSFESFTIASSSNRMNRNESSTTSSLKDASTNSGSTRKITKGRQESSSSSALGNEVGADDMTSDESDKFIENTISRINAKVDTAPQADPMFLKLSKEFDKSGAVGMLLNIIHTHRGCALDLDSNHVRAFNHHHITSTSVDENIESKVNDDNNQDAVNVDDMDTEMKARDSLNEEEEEYITVTVPGVSGDHLCPSLEIIRQSALELNQNDGKNESSVSNQSKKGKEKESDKHQRDTYDDNGDCTYDSFYPGGDDYDDVNYYDGNQGDEGTETPYDEPKRMATRRSRDDNDPVPDLKKKNEYSYFGETTENKTPKTKRGRKSASSKSVKSSNAKAASQSKAKKKRTTSAAVTDDIVPPKKIVEFSDASDKFDFSLVENDSEITEDSINDVKIKSAFEPYNLFTRERFTRLFLKPEFDIYKIELLDQQRNLTSAYYNEEGTQDDDPGDYYGDTGGDYNDYEDQGDTSASAVGGEGDDVQFDLVGPTRKIKKIEIGYSTRAKKIDMARIKPMVWNIIDSYFSFESSKRQKIETRKSKKVVEQRLQDFQEHKYLSFNDLLQEPELVQAKYSKQIYFLSILDLAATRGLELTSKQDLSDVEIHPSESTQLKYDEWDHEVDDDDDDDDQRKEHGIKTKEDDDNKNDDDDEILESEERSSNLYHKESKRRKLADTDTYTYST